MVLMCSREYSKYFFSFESCKQGCTCSLQSTRQSGGSFVAFLFSFFFVVLFFFSFFEVCLDLGFGKGFDGFGNLGGWVCEALSLPTFYSMGPKFVTKSLGKVFWVEVGMSPRTLVLGECFKLCKGTLSLWIHGFFMKGFKIKRNIYRRKKIVLFNHTS